MMLHAKGKRCISYCKQGCKGTSGGAKIVIAGDFMTHSSYVGCYASADAAADAVVGGVGLR